MPQRIILIGGGGQCKSAIPIIASHDYFLDGIMDGAEHIGKTCAGVPFKYTDDQMEGLAKDFHFVITVGQTPVNNPTGRKRIFTRLKAIGASILTIQSKCSIVHGYLSEGAFIHDMAMVNVDSVIGENTIINTAAIVEHDAQIGSHCHICPGAIVLGGISIASDTIIGAGSVVVAPITEPGFYAGVPARPIMTTERIIKPKIHVGGIN